MLHVTLLVVGSIKEKYLKEAISDYENRLVPYIKLNTIELPEGKISLHPTPSQIELAKMDESTRLISKIPTSSKVVLLDIQGHMISSDEWAGSLDLWMQQGMSHMTLIIGGPHGVSEELKKRADWKLSLSRMTWTHLFARLLLLEQLYRAFRINRGEPYHK